MVSLVFILSSPHSWHQSNIDSIWGIKQVWNKQIVVDCPCIIHIQRELRDLYLFCSSSRLSIDLCNFISIREQHGFCCHYFGDLNPSDVVFALDLSSNTSIHTSDIVTINNVDHRRICKSILQFDRLESCRCPICNFLFSTFMFSLELRYPVFASRIVSDRIYGKIFFTSVRTRIYGNQKP